MSIIIDYDKCCWKDGKCKSCTCNKACVGCVESCPTQAITRDKIVTIDLSKCLECGACISACQHQAISMQ